MLSRATFNIVRRSLYKNTRTLYCLPINLTYDSNIKQHSAQDYCSLYVAKRFKSNKKNKKQKQDSYEDSDEEEDVIEEIAPTGSKIVTTNIQSIRWDAISKFGFGITRNKMDEAFYASKIRINGQKVLKKSQELDIGDEVDLILHRSIDNPSFLVIHRIVVLSMVPTANGIKIKLSRDKNLLIEDYEEPWSSE